ncbi:Hypothetical predicted protein [Marmota monax]|uniref:Uncharacterized protein n=1 Tax=Marmota monax TaxID=9995 RepID=A0A5E4B4T5_MARMO|nr:hypothetical protein GHT09_006049 [Marmota monax]VTJ63749.1 Hypothetical predicted protein [Marmota monax]
MLAAGSEPEGSCEREGMRIAPAPARDSEVTMLIHGFSPARSGSKTWLRMSRAFLHPLHILPQVPSICCALSNQVGRPSTICGLQLEAKHSTSGEMDSPRKVQKGCSARSAQPGPHTPGEPRPGLGWDEIWPLHPGSRHFGAVPGMGGKSRGWRGASEPGRVPPKCRAFHSLYPQSSGSQDPRPGLWFRVAELPPRAPQPTLAWVLFPPAQQVQEPASLASLKLPASFRDTTGTKVTLGSELPSCPFSTMSSTRVPRAGILVVAYYLFLCRGPGAPHSCTVNRLGSLLPAPNPPTPGGEPRCELVGRASADSAAAK